MKTELEALGRMLWLKWHFRNEENEFDLDYFKPKSTFNPFNQDAAIEAYMNSLVEKLMEIKIPKNKYNNLFNKEWQALCGLINDKNLVINPLMPGSNKKVTHT